MLSKSKNVNTALCGFLQLSFRKKKEQKSINVIIIIYVQCKYVIFICCLKCVKYNII